MNTDSSGGRRSPWRWTARLSQRLLIRVHLGSSVVSTAPFRMNWPRLPVGWRFTSCRNKRLYFRC